MTNSHQNSEEHLHKNGFTIYVNATPETWYKETISYEEVTKLAFETPPYGQNTEYQVVYTLPHNEKEGSLAAGQTIKVKKETEFDVTATDKS